MSFKSKFFSLFVVVTIIIVVINHTVYYFYTQNLLLDHLEERMKMISQHIRISFEHSKLGSRFIEDLLGEHLRTAALVANYSLDPDIDNVTNEQLVQLRDKIGITDITLFKKTENDIIGYRSSDPKQINLSTYTWTWWYDAFQQLFDLKPVTVDEGQKLPHYWSGPFEVSSANPNNIDKWGYYYDGTTNYIIDPFIRDDKINKYDQLTGPSAIVDDLLHENQFIQEISVFNYGKFCFEPIRDQNQYAESFVKLFNRPLLYGTYTYQDNEQDCASVNHAVEGNQIVSYVTTIKDNKLFKSFIPVMDTSQPYVIGLVADYSIIEQQLERKFSHLGLIILLATLLSVPFIIITHRMIQKSRETAVQTTQETYIQEVNDMFTTIRGQRHDFLNHVHTIKAMLDMNKMDELRTYAGELLGEIKEVNNLIRIGHPAISALVQAKTSVAMDKKIPFEVDIAELHSLSLGVKSVDIVKMIGNLVDNAFDEVIQLPVEERWVRLKVAIERPFLMITLQNSGRLIPEDELNKLFDAGYSTRNDGKHSGIGLAVTKERVLHYNGKIEVSSSPDDGITFTIWLPKH